VSPAAESPRSAHRSRSRRRLAAGLSLAVLVGLLGLTQSEEALAAQGGNSDPVALGAWIPNSFEHPQQIDRFAAEVGRRPAIVSRYPSWSVPPFQRGPLNAIWSRGAVPLVTWEPWTRAEKGIPLTAIAAGRYDPYIRRSAREAASWNHPILLRFAHEMNGTWYPWGRRPGNSPRLYIAAWRHVVSLFREAGADNVRWVWAANVDEQAGPAISWPILGGGPSHPYPFRAYYPGDEWVDWVGLDGFNWGKAGEWQSFTSIFGGSYDTVIHMTSRPIIVSETASNETLGDKAGWVTSAFGDELPRFPRIRGVVWFDEGFSGVAARLNSSPESLAAFRAAVSSPEYGLSREAFLATPRSLPTGPQAPTAVSGDYGAPSLWERLWFQAHRHMPWSALGAVVAVVVLGGSIRLLFGHAQRMQRAKA
jgi:mannan endo-1,4-beta-mannosidase